MKPSQKLSEDLNLLLRSIKRDYDFKSQSEGSIEFASFERLSLKAATVDLEWVRDELASYRSHSFIFGLAFIFFLLVGFTFTILSMYPAGYISLAISPQPSAPRPLIVSDAINQVGLLVTGFVTVYAGVASVLKKNRCLREAERALFYFTDEIENEAHREESQSSEK